MDRNAPGLPWQGIASIAVVIALCWVLPRLAVRLGGPDGHWTAYLYQYFLGGLVFAIGLVVIRASRACDFRRPGEAMWFGALAGGYVAYALMHGVVTWLAYAVPFRGVK